MDVEGFGRGEVAPLVVACCMSRSGALTCSSAVLPDGSAVRVGRGRDLRERLEDVQILHVSISSLIPYQENPESTSMHSKSHGVRQSLWKCLEALP